MPSDCTGSDSRSRVTTHLLVLLIAPWLAVGVCTESRLVNDIAYYTAPISAEENLRFFAALADRPVRRLVIRSGGGEVEAAIALGTWVFEQRLDLEVHDYCLSSCANYVFPAAVRKLIKPGAVVAWHGNYHHLKATGLWTDDIAPRMERYGEDAATARDRARAETERLVRLEREYFTRIGVDQYLCWVGKMPPYNVPDYYFLSREDMAGFGVSQVQTPVAYASTDTGRLDRSVVFIRLQGGASATGRRPR